MAQKTVLVSGCDAYFYPFLTEAISSWLALNLQDRADIGILDFGLLPAQVDELKAAGYKVVKPEWTIDVPDDLKTPHYQIGYVARTALRDYFPGYNVYVWFDADAWAQTSEFFDRMVEGVLATGGAVIRENGAGMSRNLIYNKWWYGHMVAAYGLDGFKFAYKPAINIGIVALSEKSLHWDAWIKNYSYMIHNRHRVNVDQHSFVAAVERDHLPVASLPAECNWICTLSSPIWDKEKKLFCSPGKNSRPLSVMHLAGGDKRRLYKLKTTDSNDLSASLDYAGYLALARG